MTTYRSKAQNIIERLKRTLLKYDLEIARVEGEILLYSETMDLLSQSTKKKDLHDFALAKVSKENYEVFLNRLKSYKKTILANIKRVLDKYDGLYYKVLEKRYFEMKKVEEIAVELELPLDKAWTIVRKLERVVESDLDTRDKKKEG